MEELLAKMRVLPGRLTQVLPLVLLAAMSGCVSARSIPPTSMPHARSYDWVEVHLASGEVIELLDARVLPDSVSGRILEEGRSGNGTAIPMTEVDDIRVKQVDINRSIQFAAIPPIVVLLGVVFLPRQ